MAPTASLRVRSPTRSRAAAIAQGATQPRGAREHAAALAKRSGGSVATAHLRRWATSVARGRLAKRQKQQELDGTDMLAYRFLQLPPKMQARRHASGMWRRSAARDEWRDARRPSGDGGRGLGSTCVAVRRAWLTRSQQTCASAPRHDSAARASTLGEAARLVAAPRR